MDYQMEELLPVVSELAQKYNGYESTSMTYERAQTLMGAVLYCLEEFHNSHANGLADKNIPLKEQYDIGVRLVYEKAQNIQKIFNELSLRFEDYGVKCLHDTVRKGIPEFLKWYDVKYHPQNTILTLDYPLLIDCHSLSGADAVYKYILGIQAEQNFLGRFDRAYIISVLKKYHSQYEYMVENVCEIVLANTIGHVVLQKPFDEMGFQSSEYLQLTKIFGGKPVRDLEEFLRNTIMEIVKRLPESGTGIVSEITSEYLCCGVENIAVRIKTAAEMNQLNKIFLI